MINFPSPVSGNSGIKETQYVSPAKDKTSEKINQEPVTQNSIDSKDQAQVKSYASGSSPASINFDQDEEDNKMVNPLITLVAVFMAFSGQVYGGASYNPELTDAMLKELERTSKFLSQHGLGTDIDFLGNIRAKKLPEIDLLD